MNKYASSIKTLLKKEEEGFYFLSIYFPTDHYLKKDIKIHLKSLILKAFRSHRRLKHKNRLHQKIVKQVNRKISLLKGRGKGFAIFVKFKPEKPKEKDEKIGELTLFFLHRKPRKDVYVGKMFDLAQLIWLDTAKIEACILNLRRRKCDIYIVDDGEFKFFETEDNKFIKDEKEKEYIEKHKGAKVAYGTGSQKLERKKLEENKRFLNYLKRLIKKEPALRAGVRYLLIFYSASFSELIDEFVKKATSYFPEIHIVLVSKSMRDEEKLEKKALKELKKEQKKIKEKLLEEAQSFPQKYVEGWKRVTEHSRKRKIDILFIDPTVRKKGYLYKKGFIYTYPVKNSRLVRNIVPWLVRNVTRTGGTTVLFRNEEKPVAAKLKYR